MKKSLALLLACGLYLVTASGFAHHSYAEFNRDERFQLEGKLIGIRWSNPHIEFVVDDGIYEVSVEWVTLSGAERTDVQAARFRIGERIRILGARHRNPMKHVVTLVREIELPEQEWLWVSPFFKDGE